MLRPSNFVAGKSIDTKRNIYWWCQDQRGEERERLTVKSKDTEPKSTRSWKDSFRKAMTRLVEKMFSWPQKVTLISGLEMEVLYIEIHYILILGFLPLKSNSPFGVMIILEFQQWQNTTKRFSVKDAISRWAQGISKGTLINVKVSKEILAPSARNPLLQLTWDATSGMNTLFKRRTS